MFELVSLPEEITLRVLECLSPSEAKGLVASLEMLASPQCDTLRRCALVRLYRGRTRVHSPEGADGGLCDSAFSWAQFERCFGHEAAHERAAVFRQTRPQTLEFSFVRSANDYTVFTADLRHFGHLVDELAAAEPSRSQLSRYLLAVHRIDVHIDASCDSVDAPSTLAISVLRALVALATPKNPMRGRVHTLSVRSTDLGDYYQTHWSRLLGGFGALSRLDLSDNVLRSVTPEGERWTDSVTWPPSLRHLVLDGNLIRDVMPGLVEGLPPSLQTLSVRDNRVVAVGEAQPAGRTAELAGEHATATTLCHLPNLRHLDLGSNRHLTYVNPESLRSASLETLTLQGCCLDPSNYSQIQAVADCHGFTLV
ncbi:F-box domain-containing protein [[Candida] zeylanoides]